MIKSSIFLLTFLFVLLHTSVKGQDKHMICKTVASHGIEGSYHTPNTSRRLYGAPGKAGAKGQKGDIGPSGVKGQRGSTGIAGAVDYGRIIAAERRITERMEELEEKFMGKLSAFTGKLSALTTSLTKRGKCIGMYFQNVCYFPFFYDSQYTDYDDGVKICRRNNGKPADILNSQHYKIMVEYIRSLFQSGRRELWLGMKIDPSTKVLRFSNGYRAPYVKYYPDTPYSYSSYTEMVIHVKKDPFSLYQGMFNYYPTSGANGVLCQK